MRHRPPEPENAGSSLAEIFGLHSRLEKPAKGGDDYYTGDAPTRKVPQIFAEVVKKGARAGAKFSAAIDKSAAMATTPGRRLGEAPTTKSPQIFDKAVKIGPTTGPDFWAEIAKSRRRQLLLGEDLGKLQPPNRHKFLTRR